jgi:hypothetical protein
MVKSSMNGKPDSTFIGPAVIIASTTTVHATFWTSDPRVMGRSATRRSTVDLSLSTWCEYGLLQLAYKHWFQRASSHSALVKLFCARLICGKLMVDRSCHWSSRARFESLLHAGFLNGDVRVDFGRWFLVGVIHGRPNFPPRNRVSWLIDGIRSLERSFVVFKAHDKIPANLQLIFHLSQQFQCLKQKRIIASAHNQHYNELNRMPMHPVDQKKKHSYFLVSKFLLFSRKRALIPGSSSCQRLTGGEGTEPREKNRSIIPSIICCWLSAGCLTVSYMKMVT